MAKSSLRRIALSATALTLSFACPAAAQDDAAPARESTAFTLGTDQPRTVEQLAMRFDKADLSIKVLPETRSIDAVAVLDFTATAPIERLVVELDTLLTVSQVAVDGVVIPAGGWSNPEGRMTVELGRTLAAGETAQLRIASRG